MLTDKNLLQYIFQFLDPKSLCKSMQTSKHWCTNARTELVWKRHKDRIESVFSVQFVDIRPIYTQFANLFEIDFLDMDNLYLIRDIYALHIPTRHRKGLELLPFSLSGDKTHLILRGGGDICTLQVSLRKQNLTIHIQLVNWTLNRGAILNAYYDVLFDVTSVFETICPKWLML